ncbi:MAG TPA: RidA family protein [Candidatus Thermoplasmatota archaeon]|nr:RidA family protein [Candidatus Thermoplasmatota archaeon]
MGTALSTASEVEKRLAAAGHTLPPAPKAAAAYIQWTKAGNTLYVAGQIPTRDGKPVMTGKCGRELTLAQAQEMARVCALNAIAVLKEASGGQLDRVRLLRTVNLANCAPGFTDIHLAANGASELFALAFGEKGRHARTSVGMAELPLDVPFEVEVTAVLD